MVSQEASESAPTRRDIIVIGGSSGSIEPLKTLVKGLPANFSASIFIVSHTSPDHESYLGEILRRLGDLPAASAVHGEAIRPGRIYVAPPDHHLIIEQGYLRLWRGPKENHSRITRGLRLIPPFARRPKPMGRASLASYFPAFSTTALPA
jgi:chemotaxis response regulator CheB